MARSRQIACNEEHTEHAPLRNTAACCGLSRLRSTSSAKVTKKKKAFFILFIFFDLSRVNAGFDV